MKAKSSISLKARALKYLSMREHSRAELARKLARHVNGEARNANLREIDALNGREADEIADEDRNIAAINVAQEVEAVLDFLEERKFLSSSRFAESLVNRRLARFGNNRILSELQTHGLDSATMAESKARLMQDETLRARQVWQRKFGQTPRDAAERMKQFRFLQQRGFSAQAISLALGGRCDDED